MRMWCNGSTRPFQGFRASSSLVIRSSHFWAIMLTLGNTCDLTHVFWG